MQINWNRRKQLHKNKVQLPLDWFGKPMMAAVSLFWNINMAAVMSFQNASLLTHNRTP